MREAEKENGRQVLISRTLGLCFSHTDFSAACYVEPCQRKWPVFADGSLLFSRFRFRKDDFVRSRGRCCRLKADHTLRRWSQARNDLAFGFGGQGGWFPWNRLLLIDRGFCRWF